ncbi:polyphosphate kinase 1 [Flectobacillus sp. DC10W]|jgi:polyphosphate kinase|uniref:Polyphosphate kinase n=1 Tax=Flectobacillus longus TaxID=2984207 RepID=A0ABT6YU40_9BACT|nr:polyphosphate kinase 1 [Flectobacillus longus]MDI9867110.1 polyphosphate kinase 1 [Flectobacillus longus]
MQRLRRKYRKRGEIGSLVENLFSFLGNFMNTKQTPEEKRRLEKVINRSYDVIEKSDYISRDLSWLKFDERVLDQARDSRRNVFDRLKFLAITASNLDEFFSIRVGSLYNYIDFGKERSDYSGLREIPFKKTLMAATQAFVQEKQRLYKEEIVPLCTENGFRIIKIGDLYSEELEKVTDYFNRTIYPMLTPMVFDQTHTFPSLLAKTLIFGVVTRIPSGEIDFIKNEPLKGENSKISFVQIPQNLKRFFVFEREDEIVFFPIEEIIRHEMWKLYKNVEIESIALFRITRNGDFDVVEHEDSETDFIDEIKKKIKDRRLGRVTRIEIEPDCSPWMLEMMMKRWKLEKDGIFYYENLIDFTAFWQIIKYPEFKGRLVQQHPAVPPLGLSTVKQADIFETVRQGDILMHHPYNNFEPVLQLLEQAADDPQVLAIKITLYRISKNSRIADALLHAAENGKHVSVLFEVKARFDEENNIREALRLQNAGCFVIYGIPGLKTHTKLLQVIRSEGNQVVSYAHLSSGNYNEDTAKLYTDIGLLTTNEVITRDISEFFNVITGHSQPHSYKYLITAPREMRNKLVDMIRNEAKNAQAGLPSGICIKINSLQDKITIDELYKASQAGVPIQLIVRGICCIRPGRKGLSDNIKVRSIVGDFLEHTRVYYFHNNGNPKVYGGSADVMVRSFDRRIESLFELVTNQVRQQAIHILQCNLRDNVNTYEMQEDGSYKHLANPEDLGIEPFDIHKEFFNVKLEDVMKARLFAETTEPEHIELESI